MNRQTRTFIVVAVAVVAATIASYGTYRALSQVPQRPVERPTIKMLVAAKQMPLGTLITRDAVKLVDWPAQTPLQGGFSSIDAVVDRGLITSVVENEPISENKLAPKEAGAGLSPTIKPGMRAISVRVNEVIGVAGFVLPGSRVDVMTILGKGSTNNETFSRVVVSNVPVLSAGTRYDQDDARTDGKAIRSTVVTVMVTPLDADRIALAQSQGELMLTLRHPLDVDPTDDSRGVRLAALFAGGEDAASKPVVVPAVARRVAPPPPPPPAPVVKAYTVETIRAAKRSEETLLGGYIAR